MNGEILELSLRGMAHSAKWLASLGCALDNQQQQQPMPSLSCTFLLAKSMFDCKEFERAVHCLNKQQCSSMDKRALFLMFYCKY